MICLGFQIKKTVFGMLLLSEGQVTHASLIAQCNSGQCLPSNTRQTRLICEKGCRAICVQNGVLLASGTAQQKSRKHHCREIVSSNPYDATAIRGWDSKMLSGWKGSH